MRGRPNILKTLNTDNQQYSIETTYRLFAAQPCSYIYPIYSVVKNRPRQLLVAMRATGAPGAKARDRKILRIQLKDQFPIANGPETQP